MKKTAMTLLFTPFLMTMLILGMGSQASAAGTTGIVLVQCVPKAPSAFPPGPEDFEVNFARNSADAPEVPVGQGTNCAQALADLLNAGFTIRNIESNTYVLRRKN